MPASRPTTFPRAPLFLLLASALLLAACGGGRVRILNPKVPRNPYIFETDRARDIFEDALRGRWNDGEANLPGTRDTLSLNAFFNREVVHADSDGDGILSESEARTYADG